MQCPQLGHHDAERTPEEEKFPVYVVTCASGLGKEISISFQIERNTIVVTFFLLIKNQMEFCRVHNQKGNCHYDHIPFTLKGIRNRFLFLNTLQALAPPHANRLTGQPPSPHTQINRVWDSFQIKLNKCLKFSL